MPQGVGLSIWQLGAAQERTPDVLPEGTWRHGLAVPAKEEPGRAVLTLQDGFSFPHGQEPLEG